MDDINNYTKSMDSQEDRAKALWHRGKQKQREAEERLKAADLMKESDDLLNQAQEIYNKVDSSPFKKVE